MFHLILVQLLHIVLEYLKLVMYVEIEAVPVLSFPRVRYQ